MEARIPRKAENMTRKLCVVCFMFLMLPHALVIRSSLAGQTGSNASGESDPVTQVVDLSDPLQALAGELIVDRQYSAAESARAQEQILAKARKIFAEKQLPALLKLHNVEKAAELDKKLAVSGHTLADTENTFVWKLLISRLKRQQER